MSADTTPPRKQPAVTATTIPHQNLINEQRAAAARHRLANLAQYVFGEGFLPEVAATAAGFPNRSAALKAARHAGRPALADALRPPTTAERRAAQIEDLEFLLDVGESPERAVIRCGFTSTDSAWSLLRKWGRADLATRLAALLPTIDPEWDETEAA